MDPINNHHHAETSPLSKKGSDSPSPDDLKIQQIASRLLSNPLAKSPSIGERVVTSSIEPSDLQFVKSLITRSILDFPLHLSDEDLLRIEKINEIYKSPRTDGSSTDKETFTLLLTLYENEDFLKEISRHDLKNIQMDPINNHHHAETSPPSKKGSDSPPPDDLKFKQIASRPLSNLLAKSPSIGERVVTSSLDESDYVFVLSLFSRSSLDFPLTLSDEDLLRIEKINKNLKTLPLDDDSINKEISDVVLALYDEQNFITAISDHDLKNIEEDQKAFEKIKKRKRLSCKNINKLLSIYSNQTDKKYQQHPSYQSLMTDLSDYINDVTFQHSIIAKLYDKKNELDQLTLKEILKLPIHNMPFKKSLETKISELSDIEDEILFQFIESLTFNQLYEIFSGDANDTVTLNNNSLTTLDCIAIFNSFEFDFFERLETIIEKEDPIDAIDLLQRLKIAYRKENFDLSGLNIDLETEASARLFTDRKEARGGISQVNFKDEELGIGVGGANFCCGSIAVEALVSKFEGKSFEEVIKNGVIRHLKLPKEQMSTLTSVSMLIENNKDIKLHGESFKKSIDPNKTLYSGYLNHLNQIPTGSSGLILADTAFFMYNENPDGSIEIFDSHGSSIPLITGVTHPAYRAFFKDKKSAAAYLSVHRKVDIDRDLSFFPLEIVPS